ANSVRHSGEDRKWRELSDLVGEIFAGAREGRPIAGRLTPGKKDALSAPLASSRQKLVVFTEHRATLNYLERQLSSLLGRGGSVVTIHGGVRSDERRKTQQRFHHDPDVLVLVATDAAGEGTNHPRAHLTVHYDPPWNPTRLEQR